MSFTTSGQKLFPKVKGSQNTKIFQRWLNLGMCSLACGQSSLDEKEERKNQSYIVNGVIIIFLIATSYIKTAFIFKK